MLATSILNNYLKRPLCVKGAPRSGGGLKDNCHFESGLLCSVVEESQLY